MSSLLQRDLCFLVPLPRCLLSPGGHVGKLYGHLVMSSFHTVMMELRRFQGPWPYPAWSSGSREHLIPGVGPLTKAPLRLSPLPPQGNRVLSQGPVSSA